MIYECNFELREKVYFLTNRNFKEYYIEEGEVGSIQFTRYGKVFIEIYIGRECKSCDSVDVFKTLEKAAEALPRLRDKYLKNK